MGIPESRPLHGLALLVSAGLITAAMIFEHVMGMEPCPLCMSQRVVVAAIALTSLIAAVHNPDSLGRRRYGCTVLLLAIIGAALAIRQLYLQGLPPEQAPACMPGVSYLVDILPLVDLLTIMLSGTGDCAQVQWVFLGLSIPGWTLICFIAYACFGFFELLRKHHLYH
ncbi:disulfide bond formation protein B [Sansalvadorimonas verongulae]|uniref:disulfide bond formation protein B n=1 Tax=Sansalvadorimonas verongulae TaxID=2172824 RepID=UPI0012BBEE01|nr:disulfide bond formation protein B [Sansalvadorimonas verongulae]MTI14061.1 disulfide bond formation protein B [Sansalvadorimonas verongulae]